MNIIVRTCSGQFITRPDTTWEKDNEDFYPPEFINKLTYSPILFARISKPGRSVSRQFAHRYYDAINYGVLLYPENLINGSETSYATASMIDHTSFLPAPLYNRITLSEPENEFKLYSKKEGREETEIFSYNEGTEEIINMALSDATSYIYIRTGDILCIELDTRKDFAERSDGQVSMRGTFCNNPLLDFNVIF